MFTKMIGIVALLGMTTCGLAAVGCSPNDNNNNGRPYSLSGTSAYADQRFVDQKSHYRPDLALANNPAR